MDGFRVIRDFADYTNAQYGYEPSAMNQSVANSRSAAAVGGGGAPWHDVNSYAFKNPYNDFSTAGATGMAGRIGPVQPLSRFDADANTGGGRGNRKGGYRAEGRFPQQMQPKKKIIRRREHIQYPYATVPDNIEFKLIQVDANSPFCFHGYQSIFTLQHRFDFIIEGETFKSVDQYYQLRKVKDLTGIISAKFTDGSTRDYSTLARELLKQSSIKRSDVENWRTSQGLLVIQKALLEKVRQCYDLRNAITSTGQKMIVQSFAGDDFYGAGVPAKFVKDWCSGLGEKKASLKFPIIFPLTEANVKYVPVVGKGKNVLGAIYMVLREKINAGQLDNLKVNGMPAAGEPMNVDFTVDSNS